MPTILHDRFIIQVAQDIDAQLDTIGLETGKTGQFARDLEWLGSGRIFLAPKLSTREPDASFRHVDAEYPGVVIEISYSQKRKDLPRLADSFLLDSNGSTRVFIGIDIEYRGSHKATVSIWRPKYIWNEEQEVLEFRAVQTAQEEVRDSIPINLTLTEQFRCSATKMALHQAHLVYVYNFKTSPTKS
jgi:hypothetical protein